MDWISKTADAAAEKVGDEGLVAITYPGDALLLHMNNSSFGLLCGLMIDAGCDLSKMPVDNSGDFVDGDTARGWADKLIAARPNMVLTTIWEENAEGGEPTFDEVLTLAGAFDLDGYIAGLEEFDQRMSELMKKDPKPPRDRSKFTVEEEPLDELEGEEVYFRELIDQAIVLLRDGDGFYQW